MKILLVDDHALLREALRGALKELESEAAIFEASDSRETMQLVEQHPDLDLVLLDLKLPDRDGFSVLAELRNRYPSVSVVVISALQDRDDVLRALDLGALGFIPKSATRKVILGALQLVCSGVIYIPPQVLSCTEPAPVPSRPDRPSEVAAVKPGSSPADLGLTERQLDVLALVMRGKTNKAICRVLNLAEPTVKNHVRAILKALKATNRTEAVIAVGQLKWELPPVFATAPIAGACCLGAAGANGVLFGEFEMAWRKGERNAATEAAAPNEIRGRLFRKYVGLFVAVVCAALVINGAFGVWFDYHEQRALLVRIQRQQADAAALRITQFIKEIEGQLAWATQLPWSADNLEEWRFDTVRMLRQVPAITDVTQLDSSGREQAYMSRVFVDVIGTQADLSADPAFVGAIANKIYYGPIRFLRDSEPYMTLAMAGVRKEYGVIVAQVNLRVIWDVVSEIKVGQRGQAYVIDPQGRVIAHPDTNMVLRNTDVSRLPQMRMALAAQLDAQHDQEPVVRDAQDRQVLSSYSRIAPLRWLVFVDLPVEEAYATLYTSIVRSGALLIAALLLAAFAGLYLARRMVTPIQAMRVGAARIGGGDLTQRITIKTGDELEALADQFNSMAARLQESYASLECKVDERTHQLAVANLAKSRFIAAASHDLRQPVQALGLFVEQLHGHMKSAEGGRLVERIDAAIGAMNELFNALLDISKLDAGALSTNVIEFQIAQLLQRIESTFAEAAREKRLSFRIVPSSAWVCSDFILLERILLNLVSNAVRYTATGGVVVGCRRRGETVHIEVWDTGPGIQEDQRRNIFGEFYRLADTHGGLGLGLAIVDRLCRLLHHPIELVSTMGKGSRFSVTVPATAAPAKFAEPQAVPAPTIDVSSGKLIVVMDDDALVLDGMGGMLRNWGCRVVAAATPGIALAAVAGGDRPNLIISDCCLANGQSGVAAIAELRRAFGASIPAFLITGDTSPERLHEAKESGHHLLHKPVRPMRLRAMLSQLLKSDPLAGAA